MKFEYRTLLLLSSFLVIEVMSLYSQSDYRYKAGITGGYGKAGIVINSEPIIMGNNTRQMELLDVRGNTEYHYDFKLGLSIYNNLSFIGSLGVSRHRFTYTGDFTVLGFSGGPSTTVTRISEEYYIRFMEVGASLQYRIPINSGLSLVNRLGGAWYTNPKRRFPSSTLVISYNSNNFSSLAFSGVELPLIGNHFFIEAGVLARIPLDSFAFKDENNIRPYSLGASLSVNFYFSRRNKS